MTHETTKYRRPSRYDHDGSTHILNHDAFVFHTLPDEFGYQQNSRGVFEYIEGTFDLPETMGHEQRVYSLAQYLVILNCAMTVGDLEHTGNWDIFMEVTMADGTTWFCYDDMAIPNLDPNDNQLFILSSAEYIETFPVVTVTAAPIEDYCKDDFDYDTGMVTRELVIDDIREIHLWFDT